MKIELKVNDCLMFASDCPTTAEWSWQDRYIQCVRYMERLAATEAIPAVHRAHITEWLECQETGVLPSPYPSVSTEKATEKSG